MNDFMSNWIYRVFVPINVAGVSGVGTFYLYFPHTSPEVSVFVASVVGYCIGNLVRSVFGKWKYPSKMPKQKSINKGRKR